MFIGRLGFLFGWFAGIGFWMPFYICKNISVFGVDDAFPKFGGLLKTAIKFSFCICFTNSSFGFLGLGFCTLLETELNCSFGLSWVWGIAGFGIVCTGFGCYFFAGTLIPIISKKSKSVELSETYCLGWTWGIFELKVAQSSLLDYCLVGLRVSEAIWNELNSSAELLLSLINLLTILINQNLHLEANTEPMSQYRRFLYSFSKSP